MREHFEPVFVEKDDEPELIERYGVEMFPAFVWTATDGEELLRSVQPADADELLEELASALEELAVHIPKRVVVERLLELTLGSEYGDRDGRARIWTRDVRIQVHGEPTPADRETLDLVVEELGELVDSVDIELVGENANVDVHFVPSERFAAIEPNYQPKNLGFVWVRWDEDGAIYHARVLLSTDGLMQKERDHMIREELTQALGFLVDSPKESESVFYDRRSVTTEYTELDRAVIRALYAGAVKPGMRRARLRAAVE